MWRKLMDGFAPSDNHGNYERPKGLTIKKIYEVDSSRRENLYLLVGRTCPWCHRTMIMHLLKNLVSEVAIIYLEPEIKSGRWIFEKDFFDFNNLDQLYKSSSNKKVFRSTVPLLIKEENYKMKILSNESGEILQILNSIRTKTTGPNLIINGCPKTIQSLINDDINNGVYKCGFARNQTAYENASRKLFSALKTIDQILGEKKGDWILGSSLSIADIYLFPTLIRWELIYSQLFKCTQIEISEFKNILIWRLNFYKLKDISHTCFEEIWIKEYYKALFPLNPNQIVPLKPPLQKLLQK